jgi:DNA-binding phage protein
VNDNYLEKLITREVKLLWSRMMNTQEATEYIRNYFKKIFKDHDLSYLDDILHPEYWDDDIGIEGENHIENSKNYLKEVFETINEANVEVTNVNTKDNIISAYLEWTRNEKNKRIVYMKGIGIFEINNRKIIKRHTYIYQRTEK